MTLKSKESGKFYKIMLSLAVPIAVQNLLTSSFSLIDTIMVGQLGDISLAAVGMASQWSWFLNMAIFGICSGASVFFSQYYGDGNIKAFRKTYGLALITGILISFIFLLSAYFFPRGIIGIFNRTPEVLDEGAKYLRIALFSYPAIMINQLSCTVLRSSQKVKLPMYTAFLTTVLNSFLDYGLIFGKFGFPALGVEGAAIATVISAWSGPVIIYIISALNKDRIFFGKLSELFCFKKDFIIEFLRKTFPVVLNESLWGLGTMTYSIIYSNMGYEYSAALTILRTFENIAFAFFAGFNNAGSIMIGQNVGSGKIETAISQAKKYMLIVPLAGVFVGITVILFRDQLISLFNTGGKISNTTLNATRGIMLIYSIAIGIKNVNYVSIAGIFRAGGETQKGMKYDIIGLWILSLPATFIAAFIIKLPFVAVYAVSHIFEDYVKCILCIRYFRTMNWIKPVTENGRAALEDYHSKKAAQ